MADTKTTTTRTRAPKSIVGELQKATVALRSAAGLIGADTAEGKALRVMALDVDSERVAREKAALA